MNKKDKNIQARAKELKNLTKIEYTSYLVTDCAKIQAEKVLH